MNADEDTPVALVKVQGYVREVPLTRFELVCAECGQPAIVDRYPGQAARFCSEHCQLVARRAADRERKALRRAARRGEAAAAGTIVRRGRPRK
jgi:endogenous inhibitor of DNA gyrase (YacG/DUF329 family)